MRPSKITFLIKTMTIIGILLLTFSTELTLADKNTLLKETDSSQQYIATYLKKQTSNRYSYCSGTSTPYPAGNGYDAEAIAFSNIEEMLSQWGQPTGDAVRTFLRSDSTFLDEVVIAIIDTGITRDMWFNIEGLTDCEIEVYVNWIYDEQSEEVIQESPITDPAYLPDIEDLPYDRRHEHGSQIAWLISQAVNGVKLWILDIQDDQEYEEGEMLVEGAWAAYDWLHQNINAYSGLDIVTMSYSHEDPDTEEEQRLSHLHYTHDIALLASAGNAVGDIPDDMLQYPRSLDGVWGVGAYYDDPDKYLEDGQFFDNCRHRVSKETCSDVRDTPWASQYSTITDPAKTYETVEFMAPGFDYETRKRDFNTEIVDDGTSFACPHAAAITAYAIATCHYVDPSFTQEQIIDLTYLALRKAAEKEPGSNPERVGLMYTLSEYPSDPVQADKVGYGGLDAYDTVRYLLGGEINYWYTSISYEEHEGNPFYSKSSTQVEIFHEGDYILRLHYRINEGQWATSDELEYLTVGTHPITRWVYSTHSGDFVEVWWEILSPSTPYNTLDAEETIKSLWINPDWGTATINSNSEVSRSDTSINSYLEFDVTTQGYLTIKIWARYKHWGQSYGDWIPKATITDCWTMGNHYLSPDTLVWTLAFWYQFCAVDVRWEIWSDGQMIDEYWGYYSRSPDCDIENVYADGHDQKAEAHATANLVLTGDWLVYTYGRHKHYGSDTWSGWEVLDFHYWYNYDGYIYPAETILSTYNYFDTVQAKIRVYARCGDDQSYEFVEELQSSEYTKSTPIAGIDSGSWATQEYSTINNQQHGYGVMKLIINTAGIYTFIVKVRYNEGSWSVLYQQDLYKDVGAWPTTGYSIGQLSAHCTPGTHVDFYFRIEVNGVLEYDLYRDVTLIEPAYVSASSYIYQDAQDIVWSYAKFYVYKTGNYWVKVEYKKPGDSDWTVKRNGVVTLSTLGINTITDSLFIPTQSGTCYVRWSIYEYDGSPQYDIYSESKYVWKFRM